MDLLPFIPDNITEVLAKIVQFTELRRGILNGNVRGIHTRGYRPRDLPVVEFANLLNVAISEHLQHHRLLFRDTENITFGDGGTMRIHPIADEHAGSLLQTNPDQYLNLQISRLFENSLNWQVARELMQRHSGTVCDLPSMTRDNAVATDVFSEDLPSRPAPPE
jgi:flagellar basal body rod protein FlgB